MGLTDNPKDPKLTHGVDEKPRPQSERYLVLSREERRKGFVRPFRQTYRHVVCGTSTRMDAQIAETYAAKPDFYGATYCCSCRMHRPIGEDGEFVWEDGTKVGT